MNDASGWSSVSDEDLTSVLSGSVPAGRLDLLELSDPVECIRSGFTATLPVPSDELSALLAGAPSGARHSWRGRVAAVAASTVVAVTGLGVMGALPAAAQSLFDRISDAIPLVADDSAAPAGDPGSGTDAADPGPGPTGEPGHDGRGARSEAGDTRVRGDGPAASGPRHSDDVSDDSSPGPRSGDAEHSDDASDDSDATESSGETDADDRDDSTDSESREIDDSSSNDGKLSEGEVDVEELDELEVESPQS